MADRPDPGGVRANLTLATRAAWRLSEQLESLIAERVPVPLGIDGGKKKPTSTPPWNQMAASLIFDLRALTRRLEDELRSAVTGGTHKRGLSDRNTQLSLAALNNLAVSATDAEVAFVLSEVNSWLERGRPVVGETEPMRRVPRLPGQGEQRCPWCQYCTLRCKLIAGLLFCINPKCVDENGRRPHGIIEVGMTIDEVVIHWQDDTYGLPQEAAA